MNVHANREAVWKYTQSINTPSTNDHLSYEPAHGIWVLTTLSPLATVGVTCKWSISVFSHINWSAARCLINVVYLTASAFIRS